MTGYDDGRTPEVGSGKQVALRRRPRLPDVLKDRLGVAALVSCSLLLVVGFLGRFVAPHAIDEPVGIPGQGPGSGLLLGADALGRDVLSRVLTGGSSVLTNAIVCAAGIYLVGVTIGLTAGYLSGWVDAVLMRFVDLVLTFPPLLFLLILITGAGRSVTVLDVGIMIVLFPGVARIVRTATMEIATTSYVEAAVIRGETTASVLRREILPAIAPVILTDVGVRFAAIVIAGASVNFLGLGYQPPHADWGLMIAENNSIISVNIWAVLVPALFIGLLTVTVNLLGDVYSSRYSRKGTR